MRVTRVTLTVRRAGAGNGPVWWARFRPADLVIVGMGSGRRVAIRREAEPTWLPKPDGQRTYISRSKGTRVDGEAWVDLPEGALIRAGATCAGGLRCARVASPVLVVEPGAVWEAEDRDGSRYVYLRIDGARPITLDEAEARIAAGGGAAAPPPTDTTRARTILP